MAAAISLVVADVVGVDGDDGVGTGEFLDAVDISSRLWIKWHRGP